MTSIVIIGAGTAAFSCARELRKVDKQASLMLVSEDAADVYSKPMLSNALTKNMSPSALVTATAEHIADNLSASIINHTRVDRIDPKNKHISAGEKHISYDKLVLAVGASQREPGLDNPQRLPIYQINHINDYIEFRKGLEKAKHVVIVGAGLIGCEFANDLVNAGYRCTVVSPGQFPLSNLLPDAAADYFMQRLAASGIDWHMGARANAVLPSTSGLSLFLDDGQSIEADMLLSSVGLTANVSLAQSAGLTTNRGIVVDNYLASSESEIFALGDCTEVQGRVLPFILPIMHGARALAATLSGIPTQVLYPIMPIVVKTPACPLVVLPPPSGMAGEWHINNESEGMSAINRDTAGQVLGFALLGDATTQRQYLVKEMMAQTGG